MNNNNSNNSDAAAPIPVGFRFHPTDEELVGYYLHGKVGRAQRDQLIQELDLYKIEPWDLHELCRIGDDAAEDQSDWYFFSHKDKKYPTGNRANRATAAGFWKATGRDKPIYTQRHLLGMRKTLVFYLGRAPHGQKTDWIMHEFRLDSHAPGVSVTNYESEGWVVCRVFRKMKSFKTKSQEDTSCSFEEEQSQVVGPNQHQHHHQQHHHQHQHQHQPLSDTTNFTGIQQLTAALSGNAADYYPHHVFNFTCKQENISVDDYGTPVYVAAMDPELPAGPSSLISRQYSQQTLQSSRSKFHHNGFVSVEPANFDDARSSTTTVTLPIHDDWILQDGASRDSMLQQRRDQTLADVTCHVHVKRQSASSDRLLVSHEGLVHLWNA